MLINDGFEVESHSRPQTLGVKERQDARPRHKSSTLGCEKPDVTDVPRPCISDVDGSGLALIIVGSLIR